MTNVLRKNEQVYNQLRKVMPGGVSSPIRSHCYVGSHPVVIESSMQDSIIDVDGTCYVDFWSACGALILGHAYPSVVTAVQKQVAKGSSFGCTTPYEGELARMICNAVPSCEQIRFCGTGTEATMTAVRLAKGVTKRERYLRFHGNYHGHAEIFHDKAVVIVPYNDILAVKEAFTVHHDIACVIIEPIAGNMGLVPTAPGFLSFLRKITEKNGALLIFDEVITGFRVQGFSCQALYQIDADLTTFGKIIGGGYPLAAVGGKKTFMHQLSPTGPIYHAGTHSGNPISVTAGIATLQVLQKKGIYEILDRKTDLLVKPIEEFINKKKLPLSLQRQNSMFTLYFNKNSVTNYEEYLQCDTKQYALFFNAMLSRGFYIPPAQGEAWFITLAHTEDHLRQAAEGVLEVLNLIFS